MTIQGQDIQPELANQIRFVSHEIRNNLSICDMYSKIIQKKLENDGNINPSFENALDCIHKSIQIISMNLNDLKSLNVNTQHITDFEKIVLEGVNMGKIYAQEQDKDIIFDVFIKNSANIKVDECRFLSCIVNIIKNATEAIDAKGKISVLGEVKNGSCILKISNNGKPISLASQKHIFDKGYTTKSDGHGFGLNICKKYLQSQNADLDLVKSNKSETVFKITMPVCE